MADRFETHMSDADALMWNIEKDPQLRSTIVAVIVLDRVPDWTALPGRGSRRRAGRSPACASGS